MSRQDNRAGWGRGNAPGQALKIKSPTTRGRTRGDLSVSIIWSCRGGGGMCDECHREHLWIYAPGVSYCFESSKIFAHVLLPVTQRDSFFMGSVGLR